MTTTTSSLFPFSLITKIYINKYILLKIGGGGGGGGGGGVLATRNNHKVKNAGLSVYKLIIVKFWSDTHTTYNI